MGSQSYNRLLRLPEVLKLSGLCRSSLYSYIQKGLWPKPIRIGFRSVAWIESEVLSVNQARVLGKSNDKIKIMIFELYQKRYVD